MYRVLSLAVAAILATAAQAEEGESRESKALQDCIERTAEKQFDRDHSISRESTEKVVAACSSKIAPYAKRYGISDEQARKDAFAEADRLLGMFFEDYSAAREDD
jgi:hypothetical protein